MKKNTTDRAKRYRAQRAIAQPERRCIYCGDPRPRDVEHINGLEADNTPANLAYSCRSCNVAKGALFSRLGIGTKTRQYNPTPASSGARSLGQWLTAVMSVKGQGPMTVNEAVALIRATPPARRSEFASEIWRKRKASGADQVPF